MQGLVPAGSCAAAAEVREFFGRVSVRIGGWSVGPFQGLMLASCTGFVLLTIFTSKSEGRGRGPSLGSRYGLFVGGLVTGGKVEQQSEAAVCWGMCSCEG